MLSINARADTRTWDFDDWYSGDSTNLVIASTTNSWDYQQWSGGNPNGFLQLTPGAAGRNLAVVFPDIDNGAPVKAFKLTADLRVGNGTQTPADGFSISYVRETDRVLVNAAIVNPGFEGSPPYQPAIGRLAGFAGGDSAGQTTDPAGSTNPESGTKTGVSIAFDAWAGNWLPDTGSGGAPGPDLVGVFVRVDDKTLVSKPLTEANQPCANTNSMQTGLYDTNYPNSPDGLEWCRLEVEKTVDNKVTVIWKGAKILDNFQLASYSVHRGRIVLAGRCGGSWQNVNFDNITLTTVPAIEATFEGLAINPDLKGWTFSLKDTGASKVSRVTSVIWNGTDVTASVVTNRTGDVTTGTYTQATRFAPGSVHHVEVTFVTDLSQTLSGIGDVTTPQYVTLPAAYALPLSAVSGATRGIALGPTWQTWSVNGNSQGNNKLNWTEEQLLGLHGANLIGGSWPTTSDVLDYQNSNTDPTLGLSGNFRYNGSGTGLWDGPDYDIKTLGFGSGAKTSTDDGTIEWFAYVNFPAAGIYYMVVNSDDGFRLSTARHAKDRMGTIISSFNDGRGNGTGLDAGTVQRIAIDQAGVYPIRGIIMNQGGGFNVEWYTRDGSQLHLVNGTSVGALEAWQSATGTGCYVDKAVPVRDAVDVLPTQKIIIDLADGSGSTVVPGSIVMKLDGSVVTPTRTGLHLELTPPGALGAWASGSSHTIELAFADSASNAYTYSWGFKTLTYQLYQGPYAAGGKWNLYAVVRAPLTWAEAKLAAESMVEPTQGLHGHLATLHSTGEADFIRMIGAGESVWVGLTDNEAYGGEETGSDPASSALVPPGVGKWVWVTGEAYTFARWNGGEPNNAGVGEDAVEITGGGAFNDNGIGINGESAPTRQYVVEFETLFPEKIAGISYSILPPGPLPGPSGCDGVFGIRALRNAGNLPTITAAVNALSASGTIVVDSTSPVVNFSDLDGSRGGGGIFGDELALPGNVVGENEDCLVLAKTRIEIIYGGAYTFGVHSDDGFALRILGQNWASVSGNGEIALNDPTTIVYQYGTGDANTRGVVNLAPGVYDLEFVWFEDGGGAYVELYAAKGAYTCDSETSYRLLSAQPIWLPKPGVSAAGWTVEYDAPGGTGLNSIADAEAALVGGSTVSGVSAINYRDPQDAGGAQGCSVAFPQDTGAADEDFAIRATAQLVIPVTGTYQFGFAGDDGGYLQIEGQTWDRIAYTADGNVGRINGDRIQFDANTGNSRTIGEITLAAGTYTIRTLFWERGGGAWFWAFGGRPGESLGVLRAGSGGLVNGVAIAPCTPRPTVSISYTPAGTVLNFTGAKLLSSANADGPFTEVSGATSPYTVPSGATAQYYRSAN
jgi:hypothetical protein